MLTKHISQNKHEFNVRRVDELNKEILEKEVILRETEGFLLKLKLRNEIKKLYKTLNEHGNEVLAFEYQNIDHVLN